MKKTVKVLFATLCMIMMLSPMIFATTVGGVAVNPDTNQTAVSSIGNKVVGAIKVVGVFVSIGAIMAIGIKYMMGSAEEKAEYKKVLIPYLLGAILLFAASVFADKIATIAGTLFQ